MRIACPACQMTIGDTSYITTDEAVSLHACKASPEEYQAAMDWMITLEMEKQWEQ